MALRLQTNVPVETRLLALTGEPAQSNFGADQLKFRTASGDLYVSEAVGSILQRAIVEQRVETGDLVTIAKREVGLGNGRKTIRWELVRAEGVRPGEQPDGTFAVPAIASPETAAPKPPASAAAPRTAWAEMLLAQTNALTDVLAEALRHSSQHGGLVKSEDVRSLMLSAYINLSKGVSSRAA